MSSEATACEPCAPQSVKSKLEDHGALLEFQQHRIRLFEEIYQAQEESRQEKSAPVKVTLPDGKVVDAVAFQTSPLDVAKMLGVKRLQNESIVARVNDHLWDLTRPLEEDCKLEFVMFDDPDGKHVFWHSSSHVLGQSLERLYKAKLTVGPALDPGQLISNGGFYYDMDSGVQNVSTDHYKVVKKLAQKIASEKQDFQRVVLTKDQALEMFKFNSFKKDLINEKVPDGENCTAYRCGPLIDLCRGPHIRNTGQIRAMEVVKNSSCYWKNSAENASLQRVYGVSFPSKKEMKEWKDLRQRALKNDHRDIGVRQKLFFFNDASPGSCFWLPHGARIYRRLMEFMRDQYLDRGFTEVISPNNYTWDLWSTSGHAQKYAEDMFVFEADDQKWGLKAMNCPGHCVMYNWQKHSYRDLPIRYADFGVLHRNEKKGALTGLTRVRRFQQDDAHIYCRPDQIEQEIIGHMEFMQFVYGKLGMDFDCELSTRPDTYVGEIETWNKAEDSLRRCLDKVLKPLNKRWKINPGDGAFYGPKIDIKIYDSFKRQIQCATVQLDFQLPGKERFNCKFVDANGEEQNCVMVHRAVLGSLERFTALLCEHCEGRWPFWLSPRQIMVVPISGDDFDYAREIRAKLHRARFYVDVDESSNTLGKKIAMANSPAQLYNYVLVVGAKEREAGAVSVRKRGTKKGGEVLGVMSIDEALAMFEDDLKNYR